MIIVYIALFEIFFNFFLLLCILQYILTRMGCCGSSSKVFVVNNKYEGQDQRALDDFRALRLSEDDVNVFYTAFKDMDLSGEGFIDIEEFLSNMRLERTVLTEEFFSELDKSQDRKITFREFVLYTWKYGIKDTAAIADFAFDIYDTDNSDVLTIEEIKVMVTQVYGSRRFHHDVDVILKKMDEDNNGKISRQEFILTVKKSPNLLYPAFEFLNHLRENIGGEYFWKRLAQMAPETLKLPEVAAIYADKTKKQSKRNRYTVIKTLKDS